MKTMINDLKERVSEQSFIIDELFAALSDVLVGQRLLQERLIIALLTRGHILLEGVPGLGKTLALKTLATLVNGSYSRIQFTADLLPSDLIGTLVYQSNTQDFKAKLGPVFANFVLADEINRAPAKVQSALLEAMQESQVTIGEQSYALPHPFMVLATQNPIDQVGTYALPEAQTDRFLMKVTLDYPNREEEALILGRFSNDEDPIPKSMLSTEDWFAMQSSVSGVYLDDKIKDYVLDLVFATRNPAQFQLDQLASWIRYGASPRASIALIKVARAHAFIHKRSFVIPEDIKAVAKDVLRHRVALSYEAQAESLNSDHIIDMILSQVDLP